MTREECLDAASKAVLSDRNDQYGEPEDSFSAIAGMWSVYLGRPVRSCDVACMMALLKIVRAKQNPHHEDSWVDIAGYAACGAECTEKEHQTSVQDDSSADSEQGGFGININPLNTKVSISLIMRLAEAEKKHPRFSEGIYQGIGRIGEEYGEMCQAVNKGEDTGRIMDEAFDLLCVVWRFCRGDWSDKGSIPTPYVDFFHNMSKK